MLSTGGLIPRLAAQSHGSQIGTMV